MRIKTSFDHAGARITGSCAGASGPKRHMLRPLCQVIGPSVVKMKMVRTAPSSSPAGCPESGPLCEPGGVGKQGGRHQGNVHMQLDLAAGHAAWKVIQGNHHLRGRPASSSRKQHLKSTRLCRTTAGPSTQSSHLITPLPTSH
jgi:hypothetical protein